MNEERPGGSIRIGDSEREDAVRRLGEHYEAGRLSAEEHGERVEQALKAKTGADLDGLFADLPGPHQTSPSGAGGPHGAAEGGQGGEGWAGPWGWRKPPWTAPENSADSAGNAGPEAGGFSSRPPWAARGFIGRIPLPLLVALGVLGLILSLGCTFGGGHPPVLLIALVVAGVIVYRKRRAERRA